MNLSYPESHPGAWIMRRATEAACPLRTTAAGAPAGVVMTQLDKVFAHAPPSG